MKSNKYQPTHLLLLLGLVAASRCAAPSQNADAEINAQLASEHRAHMERNAQLLVNSFSDDFTSVDNGRLNAPTREQSLARFQSYFGSVKFIKWEDVEPPVIKFSDDKSLAYALVRKQVIIESLADSTQLDTTNFAWTAIYRKAKGQWKLETITSTREK